MYVVYFVMYDSVLILLLSYGHHDWLIKYSYSYSVLSVNAIIRKIEILCTTTISILIYSKPLIKILIIKYKM